MDVTTVRYAGFWRRLAAHLINGLLMGIPYILVILIDPAVFTHFFAVASGPYAIMLQFAGFAISIAISVVFVTSRWQASPGKRIMGVYIGRASDGGRVSVPSAITRWAVFNAGTLVMMVAVVIAKPPMPQLVMPPAEQQRWEQLTKIQWSTPSSLTPDDQAFLRRAMSDMQMNILKQQAQLTDVEAEQFKGIQQKINAGVSLTPEEQQFNKDLVKRAMKANMKLQIFNMLDGIYFLVNAIMIGASIQKAGIHDRAAKTRAFRGRVFFNNEAGAELIVP